jgi:hypothetical protein
MVLTLNQYKRIDYSLRHEPIMFAVQTKFKIFHRVVEISKMHPHIWWSLDKTGIYMLCDYLNNLVSIGYQKGAQSIIQSLKDK